MISIAALKELTEDKSVLFVEDEYTLRENMHVYLKKIFSIVQSVSDGKIGLEEFKNHNFDIVITDIVMPNFDGISMLKEIKKINPNQKIIVLTASTESCDAINSLEMTNLMTLLKPAEHKDLIEAIYETILK